MKLKLLLSIPFVLIVALTAALAVSAQTAPPAPTIQFTKVGEDAGNGTVYFTIRVTNTSPLAVDDASQTAEPVYTGEFTIQDPLPTGVTWYIYTAGIYDGDPSVAPVALAGCSPGGPITSLTCTGENIIGRHLNAAGSDFVHGYAEVVLYGIVSQCGPVENTAVLYGSKIFLRFARGSTEVPCPSTPTPVITATPTQTLPTATATIAPPTATPTRIAPLPPKTGDSLTPSNDRSVYEWLGGILMAIGLLAGLGGAIAVRRLKQ